MQGAAAGRHEAVADAGTEMKVRPAMEANDHCVESVSAGSASRITNSCESSVRIFTQAPERLPFS